MTEFLLGLKWQLLSNSNIKFSEMIDALPKFFYISEWSFDVPDRIKFKIIEKMKEDFQKSGRKISDLDGIKVFFDDGWIVLRPSNTAPQIKAYVEAKTKERFNELLKFTEETLNRYLDEYSNE